MASELLQPWQRSLAYREMPGSGDQRMRKDSLIRFSAVALALVTVTAVFFAAINLEKEGQYATPYDGCWWHEEDGAVVAKRVDAGGPGDKAGIKVDDRLLAINNQLTKTVSTKQRQLHTAGIWSKATYELERHGVKVEGISVILAPVDNASLHLGPRLIALIYLGIGFYVLFRRWTAPKSTHFYVFCLVSFVLYSFHYTGKLNTFDSIILWSNVVAGLLQAALFLHFALTFPETRKLLLKRPWFIAVVYLPAVVLLGIRVFGFSREGSEAWLWNIDRLHMFYETLYFIIAAMVLWGSYRRSNTPLQQQQMKWISRGTVLAIAPYTLFYVIPFLSGALTTPAITTAMKISVLSLAFLPLTFGYAIVRYRLMDVDIIFKRGD